jgi:hypothetical protein
VAFEVEAHDAGSVVRCSSTRGNKSFMARLREKWELESLVDWLFEEAEAGEEDSPRTISQKDLLGFTPAGGTKDDVEESDRSEMGLSLRRRGLSAEGSTSSHEDSQGRLTKNCLPITSAGYIVVGRYLLVTPVLNLLRVQERGEEVVQDGFEVTDARGEGIAQRLPECRDLGDCKSVHGAECGVERRVFGCGV